MQTWHEFSWACFLYGAIGGDKVYQVINSDNQLLAQLRNAPQNLTSSDIERHIVEGFLNRWKCRLPNSPLAATKIRDRLVQIHPYIQSLRRFSIRDPFTTMISIDSQNQMKLGDIVALCYSELRGCTTNFAATATSKLLHIIAPNIFVMWDKPILSHYRKLDKNIKDSSVGFRLFHERMRDMVVAVDQSFASALVNPPAGVGQKFENYLSAQMSYYPEKSVAKFADEYNWVVITNGVHVPPAWHP